MNESRDALERLAMLKVAAAIRDSEDVRSADQGLLNNADALTKINTTLRADNIRALFVMAVVDEGEKIDTDGKPVEAIEIFSVMNGSMAIFMSLAELSAYNMKKQIRSSAGDTCDCENCVARRAAEAGEDATMNLAADLMEASLGVKDKGAVDFSTRKRDGRH